jgi:hypothetical protein
METVPGEDLERLKEDLPPDSLDTDSQRLEDRPGMPPARDVRTIFLGILCLIAVLACLYVAQDIAVPVVLALVLKSWAAQALLICLRRSSSCFTCSCSGNLLTPVCRGFAEIFRQAGGCGDHASCRARSICVFVDDYGDQRCGRRRHSGRDVAV